MNLNLNMNMETKKQNKKTSMFVENIICLCMAEFSFTETISRNQGNRNHFTPEKLLILFILRFHLFTIIIIFLSLATVPGFIPCFPVHIELNTNMRWLEIFRLMSEIPVLSYRASNMKKIIFFLGFPL